MRKKFLILYCSSLLLFSCSVDENDQDENIPECLKETVSAILERPVQDPKAKIEKWLYKDKEVYLIDAQNFPDGQIFIVTGDCSEVVCTFGGIDGPANDCEGWDKAKFVKTIWTDKREGT